MIARQLGDEVILFQRDIRRTLACLQLGNDSRRYNVERTSAMVG
jgi:hypothetical protein